MSFFSALHPIKGLKNYCSSFLDSWYDTLYKSWEFAKSLLLSLICTIGLILFPFTYGLTIAYIVIWHPDVWAKHIEASKKKEESNE